MEWYDINDVQSIDSPALVIYKQRVQENISRALKAVKNSDLLRPHVKTNKIAEVCQMMMANGINRFKCATIAEAEMLAIIGAPDVLLAYQPVGPKRERFLQLAIKYPGVNFSCICDNLDVLHQLSALFATQSKRLDVFIDLDVGMGRTGIEPQHAYDFIDKAMTMPAIKIAGLHAYDGHIKDTDVKDRQQHSNAAFRYAEEVAAYIKTRTGETVSIIAGGSPTFFTHADRGVECSPGTFVFWDKGYQQSFPDQPFEIAALVISRVISIGDHYHITLDLGYKAVASENPLPRVYFLNAPDAIPVMQSEEHLVCKVSDSSKYSPGDVLYGVPVHICPTVALYDEAVVVDGHNVSGKWEVIARKRRITI